MENNFGRTEKNWYLDTLKQNQRVEYDNGAVKGKGTICGIASNDLPVIGKTYIIKPDVEISNEAYNYSHIVIMEVHLSPIE